MNVFLGIFVLLFGGAAALLIYDTTRDSHRSWIIRSGKPLLSLPLMIMMTVNCSYLNNESPHPNGVILIAVILCAVSVFLLVLNIIRNKKEHWLIKIEQLIISTLFSFNIIVLAAFLHVD